jgi:hypothetical protein
VAACALHAAPLGDGGSITNSNRAPHARAGLVYDGPMRHRMGVRWAGLGPARQRLHWTPRSIWTRVRLADAGLAPMAPPFAMATLPGQRCQMSVRRAMFVTGSSFGPKTLVRFASHEYHETQLNSIPAPTKPYLPRSVELASSRWNDATLTRLAGAPSRWSIREAD